MVVKRQEHEDWIIQCSKHLVEENFKWLDKQVSIKGAEAVDTLLINFIACLIGATLHKTLTSLPKELENDTQKAHDYLCDAFLDVKIRLQDAVAMGFTGALSEFSRKKVDYYCTVKPMGPVANKLPC